MDSRQINDLVQYRRKDAEEQYHCAIDLNRTIAGGENDKRYIRRIAGYETS